MSNPINPFENFADKWLDNPKKEENFYLWIKKAKADLSEAIQQTGLDKVAEKLKESFGESPVQKALKSYGDDLLSSRKKQNLFMQKGSGVLASSGPVKVINHNFYGSAE